MEKDKDLGNYLDASVELPMYTLAIEQAIALCSVTDNVPHVKFTLEWDAPAKSQIIADDRNPIEEHFSVKQVHKISFVSIWKMILVPFWSNLNIKINFLKDYMKTGTKTMT